MVLGLVAGLVAAGCYGVAAVLQAVAARAVPRGDGMDPRLLLRLVRRAPFLGGLALDVCGFAAQFAALRSAPVFLVQAAMAASLAVTAILAARVLHVRLRPVEWTAVVVVVAGLGMLAVSAGDEGSVAVGTGFRLSLLGWVALLAAAGFAAGQLPGPARPAVLGAVAGLGFGVVAIAARSLTGLSPRHLVADPAAYALVAGGLAAFLCYATSLQHGSVTVATAATVVGETVVPALVGVAVLGDQPRAGFTAVAVAGFALSLVGALTLARFGEVPHG
jgi:drug/metabolite transporter (DMT)-like permease